MDLFEKCARFGVAKAVRAAGIYPYFRRISSAQDPIVWIDGRPIVMLGSNNYLGLTNHPAVKAAAAAALERYGTGCAGSRLLNGTLDVHVELEERLARFTQREAALTFSTGYQVNLGVLSCLVHRHDVVLLDALDHASLLDGARLGFGRCFKFRHNDMQDLDDKLARCPESGGKLVAVDGVFSMEGDLTPLREVVEVSRRHGARILLDDAHGVGVFGENGRGVAEHFGVEHEVDLLMGTFSKSLAAIGGFVAGEAGVIDYIRHHARSQIFSAAPPPASCAAVIAALDVIEQEPERRKQLWEITAFMKRELGTLGFDTGDSASPVIPIVVGTDETAFRMVTRLLQEGVFANPVITPAVPPGRALLRTSYMATHTRAHLEPALEALEKVGRELGVL